MHYCFQVSWCISKGGPSSPPDALKQGSNVRSVQPLKSNWVCHRQLAQYPWEEVATLSGNGVLDRNWMASWLDPVIGNITRLSYDKLRIFLGDAGNVRYENASGAWSKNMALVEPGLGGCST
jgi:hypothetical protein